MQRLPHATFTNLYGPTEATIASSYYTVPSCPLSEDEVIPIGQACGGEELLVLDETLRPLPPGVMGELYIRGAASTAQATSRPSARTAWCDSWGGRTRRSRRGGIESSWERSRQHFTRWAPCGNAQWSACR